MISLGGMFECIAPWIGKGKYSLNVKGYLGLER